MRRRRPIFGATLWDLTEAFFVAQRRYNEVYVNYETLVLAHAEQQAVDRHQLRLEAAEVSKLLDFVKLGRLRNGPLSRTKQISHSLFRSQGRTNKFDRYVSEIFHDLSILREEQYKVSTFAVEYKRANEMVEYESLLDEVHEDFPRRVHNIQSLFVKAANALEAVLRAHARDPIYLRSLYLFGEDVLEDSYPLGRESHCWRVFDNGPAEAWILAARSFARGGFKTQALEVLDEAVRAAGELPLEGSSSPERLAELIEEAEQLQALIGPRSPAELIQIDLGEDVVSTVGDDTAPGLDEPRDDDEELALLAEPLASPSAFEADPLF